MSGYNENGNLSILFVHCAATFTIHLGL